MNRNGGRKFQLSVFGVALLLCWAAQGHARPFTWPGGPPDYWETPNWANTPPIRKFVDNVAGLTAAGVNNLGQYIPVGVPDQTTYPGSDYYEIALVQYREKMHSDLPATLLRGYVQLSTSVVPGAHTALSNANRDGTTTAVTLLDGSQAYGVDVPHYLGPTIVAQKNRPVRVKFINALPTGDEGYLFLPVDGTIMGSGEYLINYDPVTKALLPDNVAGTFAQNRATLHLHGGKSPWISDGTPHQWTVPAGEVTDYAKGVSVSYVPDMWFDASGNTITACAKLTTCGVSGATNNPGPGSLTFYWTNQQSGRLLFYHDHAWGITRLNVYAGEAAGYLIQDNVELAMINGGSVSGRTFAAETIPSAMIPLVIQDKTYVDAATILGDTGSDPTWNWGTGPRDVDGNITAAATGDLWFPHVYMSAENPYNPDGGMSGFGRWFYGPWFYPPTPLCGSSPTAIPPYCITQGPVPNYHYLNDPNCFPNQTSSCTQPPEQPGTPDVSWGAEAFQDTLLVNGTVYPTVTVQPQAYRFRILSAGNDRFLNLQLYLADDTYAPSDPGYGKEVKMVPSAVRESCSATVITNCVCTATDAPPGCFPDTWPADGREGGVPDPAMRGPAWVQIGTEGGFLPGPVVLPNVPVSWNYDPTTFDFGVVNGGALILAPAERADVIVDFSQHAGKTLILYNDAPTAFPALVPQYDYYTGAPDRRDIGGVIGTSPGFGPNVRTVMQIKVAGSGGTAPPDYYNPTTLTALERAFRSVPGTGGVTTPATTGAFELAQEPILVGQTAYDTAYNKTFPSTYPNWGISRITDSAISFQKADGSTTVKNFFMQPKAMHDEMGGSFDELGRMAAKLGLAVVPPSASNANFILQNYVDPPTELMESGEVQIWKITHNGVDAHPIHFHLFDVQVLNRVAWDGTFRPVDPNELGWKDTVRVNPLQDTIVAMRSAIPVLPFTLPNSVRPLNPMTPLGTTMGFSQINTTNGNPLTTPMTNAMHDFGHEYVWHCHILAHEENDFMRSVSVQVPTAVPARPTGPTTVRSGITFSQINLSWTDASSNETGFRIQRRTGTGGTFADIATVYTDITTYTDTALNRNTGYQYRIYAFNAFGQSTVSTTTPLVTTGAFANATGVTLTPSLPNPQEIGTNVNFLAEAAGGTGIYQYQFRDISGGGNILLQAFSTNPTYRWYTDGLAPGTYTFRVNARVVGTTTVVTTTAAFTIAASIAKTVLLASSLPSPQPSGTSVAFTATAGGGSGSYQYQFQTSSDGGATWTTRQDYPVPGNSWTWNTTGVAAGNYQVRVNARNTGSASPAEATSTPLPYTLQPALGVTLTPYPESPQVSGTQVAFNAAAVGGSGEYEYQFSDNVSGVMTVRQAYSQASAFVRNTTGVANGTYQFKVDVRNEYSTSPSQASASTGYTVLPVAGPATGVTLSAIPGSPQLAGTQVAFIAAGQGGTGSYEYQFSDNVTGTMTVKRTYSTTSAWAWPTSVPGGSYAIRVDARSYGSASLSETDNTIAYTLTIPGPATGVLITPDQPSPQYVGVPVQFFANGMGSSGYQYRFWLYDGVSWSMVQDYGVGSTWSLPSSTPVGSYTLAVDVRTNTAVYRDAVTYFPYVVTTSPATGVTLTPDQATPHPIGAAVLFTASGIGSSGYQYRFWLHNGTSWNMVQDYGVGSSWTLPALTPVGSYNVAVDVRTSAAVYRDAVTYLPYEITP